MSEPIQQDIITADGYSISARFFASARETLGAILIVPAMATRQEYYAPFAAWAARQGFLTATFDYRGTGLSRSRRLRGFKADIFDWARLDCAAMVDALSKRTPGKRLRKVGDLPKGVMEQWRRWCLSPEYAVGVEGEGVRAQYAAVRTPIVSFSFSDDEFMSARNTESIHGFYVNSPRTMKRLAPHDVGLKRIGHFGFFRSEHEDSLWRKLLLPELT